ncbi:hypothetical protein LAZ67_20001263 [Cordylochernes scorpioides]|uniref:Uncharacterized protein n=1 Tax=Cordylochernes scorpioides TaxID=51811 RepID=A0ABY6LJT1_9ARAC|nr:hypothetical protein LAZ67_20001263 [Cordylochernes scorpioides]
MLSEANHISFGSCEEIIHKDLNLKRPASKFVPRVLTSEQNETRLEISQNMLHMVEDDWNWQYKVITGDET